MSCTYSIRIRNDELKTFDVIYLGAVGHPDVAPGILEKGLLLKLRFEVVSTNLKLARLLAGQLFR